MLISSVALRLSESSGTTWWLVCVPADAVQAVTSELREQLEAMGVQARLWGDEPNPSAGVTLVAVTDGFSTKEAHDLDWNRSRWAQEGVVAFVVGSNNVQTFLHDAPHVASFIGGKIVETEVDDGEVPAAITERRLASLRETYAMSDEEARDAFAAGKTPHHLDFLEWMVLLGNREGETGTS
jgi:hypothetical protein